LTCFGTDQKLLWKALQHGGNRHSNVMAAPVERCTFDDDDELSVDGACMRGHGLNTRS
jgi:hypothetical protein